MKPLFTRIDMMTDDLLMFKVAFVSEIFFAGSGRPLYGCFIF